MRPIQPHCVEIAMTFSNDIGITIATLIRKALFGPQHRSLQLILRPQSRKLSSGPTCVSHRNDHGEILGPKTIPSNAYGIDFRRSGMKRGATTWSSLGGRPSGPYFHISILSARSTIDCGTNPRSSFRAPHVGDREAVTTIAKRSSFFIQFHFWEALFEPHVCVIVSHDKFRA
ncbi:hypothetical protein BHM03_00052594 [Ensete ventricosum]|nr:hypothetical protein BHM03_00052594 [Ensete ventricosum]